MVSKIVLFILTILFLVLLTSADAGFDAAGLNTQVQAHQVTLDSHQQVLDNHEGRINTLEGDTTIIYQSLLPSQAPQPTTAAEPQTAPPPEPTAEPVIEPTTQPASNNQVIKTCSSPQAGC